MRLEGRMILPGALLAYGRALKHTGPGGKWLRGCRIGVSDTTGIVGSWLSVPRVRSAGCRGGRSGQSTDAGADIACRSFEWRLFGSTPYRRAAAPYLSEDALLWLGHFSIEAGQATLDAINDAWLCLGFPPQKRPGAACTAACGGTIAHRYHAAAVLYA